MKKILILIIVLLFGKIINAQQIVSYNSYLTDENKWTNENLSPKYYKDTANRLNIFVGNWKYVNGNQTFIVSIRKEIKVPSKNSDYEIKFYIDELYAHYKLVQDYGLPTQQIIYTSQKRIQSIYPQEWNSIFNGYCYVNNFIHGTIFDVTGPENVLYPQGVKGDLEMVIDPNVTPNIATWKVTRKLGMTLAGQPTVFNIPLDVTLTRM